MILGDEFLTKAVKRALLHGWRPELIWQHVVNDELPDWEIDTNSRGQKVVLFHFKEPKALLWKDFMFDLDFNKALWGEKLVDEHLISGWLGNEEISVTGRVVAWQYHLQRMVLTKNVVKYLGENL